MNRLASAIRRVYEKLNPWLRAPSAPATAPSLARWTSEDRDQWSKFLPSTTGKRFVARLRAVESLNALAACKTDASTVEAAKRAHGYSDCLAHILSLASAADQGEAKIQLTGAPANETEAQREARENRELLERYSP